jgi:hypothetical protein
MFEKRFRAVSPQPFISNGLANGQLQIADSTLFKVKQKIILSANTLPNLELEVKRIIDINTIFVGPREGPIDDRTDISAYTTALSAAIFANEQERPKVPEQAVERITYEEEPTVARRTFLVDKLGDGYTTQNPLPVQLSDGSINIGTVNAELETQLSHQDNYPDPGDIHDSVRIGDGVEQLAINPDGSINVVGNLSVGGGATTPTISNFSAALANTEYSYVIPTSSKKFIIRVRDGLSKMKVAFALGATSTQYITVNMGSSYEVDGLSTLAGFTVYFQTNKPNQVVEIITWV